MTTENGIAPHLQLRRYPITELQQDPDNARVHDRRNLDAIKASLDRFGQRLPVVVRRGRIVGGNGTTIAADELGWTHLDGIPADDLSEADARALAIALNRTAELATWRPDLLIDQLQDLLPQLEGTGFTDTDLEELEQLTRAAGDLDAAGEEAAGIKGSRPGRRELPLDVIYCFNNFRHASVFMAHELGLKVGCQSEKGHADRTVNQRERWEWRFPVTFVDNEFKRYDHDTHAWFVRELRPKYATVRDAMTKEQCQQAGIDHYPLEQILDWAEELRQWAEQVIVIPKYDCLDAIPAHFNLGYSVPTSYGGTPIPAKAFAGRRLHLLGGSWNRQLEYLALMGDDVVSCDNNEISLLAQFGQFYSPDGTKRTLMDVFGPVPSPYLTGLCLSFTGIAAAVHAITDGRSGTPPEDVVAVQQQEVAYAASLEDQR